MKYHWQRGKFTQLHPLTFGFLVSGELKNICWILTTTFLSSQTGNKNKIRIKYSCKWKRYFSMKAFFAVSKRMQCLFKRYTGFIASAIPSWCRTRKCPAQECEWLFQLMAESSRQSLPYDIVTWNPEKSLTQHSLWLSVFILSFIRILFCIKIKLYLVHLFI